MKIYIYKLIDNEKRRYIMREEPDENLGLPFAGVFVIKEDIPTAKLTKTHTEGEVFLKLKAGVRPIYADELVEDGGQMVIGYWHLSPE